MSLIGDGRQALAHGSQESQLGAASQPQLGAGISQPQLGAAGAQPQSLLQAWNRSCNRVNRPTRGAQAGAQSHAGATSQPQVGAGAAHGSQQSLRWNKPAFAEEAANEMATKAKSVEAIRRILDLQN